MQASNSELIKQIKKNMP